MKIAFHTLGCKVNQYETEAIKERLAARGHEIVGENDIADLYIINTCSVTSLADRKSRQYIRRMKKKNPSSVVLVTGCYAQTAPDEVSAIEGVDIVVGTNEKSRIPEYAERYISERKTACERHILPYDRLTAYEETGVITSMESRTRAYIKVQEGCDRFCSYCIIPYARGAARSRRPEIIISEAESLIKKGFKEIILTGINTALYGSEPGFDCDGEEKGIEIIISGINALDGDFRIRLSSLEPTVINSEYAERLFKYDKLCHHIHLSAQSGSDEILRAMNRRYGRADYMRIVNTLKGFDPHYGISTDIIAGFPGETEADFKESLSLIEEAGFCKVHAFNYSKRPGTRAAEMKGQLPPEIKDRRTAELIKAGKAASAAFFASCSGQKRRVLVEEFDVAANAFIGYTDNYIKVYIAAGVDCVCGEFADVTLKEAYKDGMKGE